MSAHELLNRLDASDAALALIRCCAARAWVEAMLAARPFGSLAALEARADCVWWRLERPDWLEAFAGHPRIGASAAELRARYPSTAGWSEAEQAGVQQAQGEVLAALGAGNQRYEARFGYVFLVCASGKSASEMLALLRERLPNDPAEELLIAAEQQRQILRLRLAKLEAR